MNVLRLHVSTLVLSPLFVAAVWADRPDEPGGDLAEVRQAETIELAGGPDVRVTFDPVVWKPWSRPEPGAKPFHMSWRPVGEDRPVVRVNSQGEKLDDKAFAEQLAFAQQVKNDPGVFVRSRRETLGGRDWLVLEYRYPTRRPISHESVYFTATKDGHVHVSGLADEAKLPAHHAAIAAFLRGVRVE